MDLWKPLPPGTNTLYVVRVDDPPVGEFVRWTPDPGVRCRVYGFACQLTIGPISPLLYPRWELRSGGDVIAGCSSLGVAAAGVTSLIRSTVGYSNYGELGAGVVGLPGLGDTYLIHGIELVVMAVGMRPSAQFANMRLYIDTWHDMTVSRGEK